MSVSFWKIKISIKDFSILYNTFYIKILYIRNIEVIITPEIYINHEYPSFPHRPPQFNTSVQHQDHTFSAPKVPQFHTKNPSVPPPPSSTPKTPQFNTKTPSVQPPQFHTKNPPVQHTPQFHRLYRAIFCLRGTLNLGVFSVELGVF